MKRILIALCLAMMVQSTTHAGVARFDAPPYGDSYVALNSFLKKFGFVGDSQQENEKLFSSICKMKFGAASRQELFAAGLTNEDIDAMETTQLVAEYLAQRDKAIELVKGPRDHRCDAPPFGDSHDNYELFMRRKRYGTSILSPDKFLSEVCRTKFLGRDRAFYLSLGITNEQIDSEAVMDLAFYVSRAFERTNK